MISFQMLTLIALVRFHLKNISINEAALENDHKIEQSYTEEETEQLCKFLVNTDSD